MKKTISVQAVTALMAFAVPAPNAWTPVFPMPCQLVLPIWVGLALHMEPVAPSKIPMNTSIYLNIFKLRHLKNRGAWIKCPSCRQPHWCDTKLRCRICGQCNRHSEILALSGLAEYRHFLLFVRKCARHGCDNPRLPNSLWCSRDQFCGPETTCDNLPAISK